MNLFSIIVLSAAISIMFQRALSFGLGKGKWSQVIRMSSFLSKRQGPDSIMPRDMAWLFEDTVWPLPALSGLSGPDSVLRQPMMMLDTKESKENYLIEADLPGVKIENIVINLQKHGITIKAEKEDKTDEEGVTYKRSERVFGKVARTISLPDNVDIDNVQAEFADGVLKVIIPKLEVEVEEEQARQIPIKATNGSSSQGKKLGSGKA